MDSNARTKSQKKFFNKFDPVYYLLDRVIFKSLYHPPKSGQKGKFEILDYAEIDFLTENLKKHRFILWVNILLAAYLFVHGLDMILENGDAGIVVTGLLAPAMITGAAWFAVSFGGIPEKFISIAFSLTLFMFLSFTLSMTLLICLLAKMTPWYIGIFVLFPIYMALYVASMLYDNVDGLKIGLDSTLLKFSRASINYYQKSGLLTESETQKEIFYEDAKLNTGVIAKFGIYNSGLEKNVNQLEEEKSLPIANYLLAASIDLLYEILDLSNSVLNSNAKINRGSEFDVFLKTAHKMGQEKVDKLTIESLNQIVENLDLVVGTVANVELEKIKQDLLLLQEYNKEEKEQNFSDLIFSQTIRKLMELINAYKHFLFGTQK